MSSLRIYAVTLLLCSAAASAQAPDEHASHHPGGAAPAPMAGAAPAMAGMGDGGAVDGSVMAPAGPMAAPATPGAPGMGDMMGKMMAPMPAAGAPAPGAGTPPGGCMGPGCGGGGAGSTPLYSSLMTLPALTPEKRAEIDALAARQINEGMGRLAAASEALNKAIVAGDDAAMQQSLGLMREGLDQLGAGVAARRVLSEGKAPRNLALDWFKREMNLASPIPREDSQALLGVTPFHFFTMALLIAFALAMVVMYFFKMRRAAALFGRLKDAEGGRPPPGSAPPLPGTPPPTTPPDKPPSDKPPTRAAASTQRLTANWRGQLRVGSIVTETPSIKTFRLLPLAPAGALPFTFVPGQFLNVAFSIGGARMNRSYSISSSPNQRDWVELTVRREPRGAVSRHVNDLIHVDDLLEASGPVGRFTFDGTEADSIVLISAGVGITPMMSISRFLTERSWTGEIFFIYACRTPADFVFARQLAALQKLNPKLHVAVTMTRPEGQAWTGPRGHLSRKLLEQTIPNLDSRRVHLCGPPAMMEATKELLTSLGVAPTQVKTEAFGATRPALTPAGASPKPTAAATGPEVTFAKNDKTAKIHVDQSVLELSEELGIGIENSCRVGTCGVCKIKLTSGEVTQAVEDALDADDKAKNIILACQAKPKGDVVVEA